MQAIGNQCTSFPFFFLSRYKAVDKVLTTKHLSTGYEEFLKLSSFRVHLGSTVTNIG